MKMPAIRFGGGHISNLSIRLQKQRFRAMLETNNIQDPLNIREMVIHDNTKSKRVSPIRNNKADI
jgi:hypothetical protein